MLGRKSVRSLVSRARVSGSSSPSAKNIVPGPLRVAVLGAAGYTGAELLRILVDHPSVRITFLGGNSRAGEGLSQVLPSFRGLVDAPIEAFDPNVIRERADVAFCAVPHGTSAPLVQALIAQGLVVFDLSADFRIRDLTEHVKWYGEHAASELSMRAVYGLCELHREAIRQANLIAVPGCYPTASNLALAPWVAQSLIQFDGIVVDAKSGVSGAGRSPSSSTHYPETGEGIRAYKIAGAHRHTAEIEQEMSALAGRKLRVLFTPHLVPMTRGILATAYGRAANDQIDSARCTDAARTFYENSVAVQVLEAGVCPDTLWVRGSNRAFVSYAVDRRTGWITAQCSIDNLGKGAAGQAVQCMNLRFGFPEGQGISRAATFP